MRHSKKFSITIGEYLELFVLLNQETTKKKKKKKERNLTLRSWQRNAEWSRVHYNKNTYYLFWLHKHNNNSFLVTIILWRSL